MKLGLVLGGAACVWDDLAALEQILGETWPGLIIAVNDAIAACPRRIDHAVSLHPDKLPIWSCERARRGGNADFTTWSHQNTPAAPVDRDLPLRGSGSSGFHAIRIAQHLGCERIVLCGVPMDAGPHFHDGKDWTDVKRYLPAWTQYKHELGDVRSMSGNTRTLLGAPTLSWLRGEG